MSRRHLSRSTRLPLAALPLALACATRTPAPVRQSSVPPSQVTTPVPNPPVEPPPLTLALDVVATTDVHGRARGWDYYADAPDPLRGLARVATVVDSIRATGANVVLVDAGDIIQGNPLAYVAARVDTVLPNPVIAAMNVLKYDAAAIGNHEFNYGVPHLARAARQATFPLLATNVYRADGSHAFPAMTIVERAGLRIAIVGATTPGSNLWDRDNLAAARLTVRDIVPETRLAVDSARRAGADVVIVSVHSGLNEPSSYDTAGTGIGPENVAARLAQEVPGIDVIVYGHSHKEMADTTINSVLLVQPKNWATSVSVAHLEVAVRSGQPAHLTSKRGTLVPVAGRAESPAVLAATQRQHDETVRYVTAPIGRTPVAWRADSARVIDTPLIDFINAVEMKATGADLASTAAFSLDARLDAGTITIARLAQLYPYDNTLRAVRISGAQLRAYLEQSARYFGQYGTSEPAVDPKIPGYNFDIVSGADYTLDLSKPVGSRVTRLVVKGKAVAPTDSFTLALNNYRQSGGGGYAMLRGAPVVYDRQQEIRQLLIDEVRRRGAIRPADVFRRNWRLAPAAAVAPALAAMRGLPGEGQSVARPSTSSSGTRPTPSTH